ncbi:MAG: slipin family protein [Patescibacteria group bacterium]
MIESVGTLVSFASIVLFIILISIKQIDQYEKGLKFTVGKFTKIMEPGWRLVLPIFQSYKKVDVRTKAVDVPDQEGITKDNISVKINAVIYYKVSNVQKAVLEVEDFYYAVSQLAQTTMRNVAGQVELDQLLSNREEISKKIRETVDKISDAWGIEVESVELKDITLPEGMKRVIGAQAEAEREKRAVIIKSEGERDAATNMSQAAEILSKTQGALHLRTLQTLNEISGDPSSKVVIALPLEILRAFETIANKK